MKVGLSLGMLHPALWIEATQLADSLGYESVWLPEHLVMPVVASGSPNAGEDHPPVPPDIQVFDVFAYMAFLAARTSTIRLGTNVYNIGLRHPFSTARAISTIDQLSGGRIEFGIGASWMEQEWNAVQLDFSTRGRRIDETLDICQRLWNDDVIEHHGEFFDFDPVMFEPKPVQRPRPPIHIGGDAKPALRRCALRADGWMPLNTPMEAIAAGRAEIESMMIDAGRAGRVEVSYDVDVLGVDSLDRFADAGIDRITIHPWARMREALDGIKRFADEHDLGGA